MKPIPFFQPTSAPWAASESTVDRAPLEEAINNGGRPVQSAAAFGSFESIGRTRSLSTDSTLAGPGSREVEQPGASPPSTATRAAPLVDNPASAAGKL